MNKPNIVQRVFVVDDEPKVLKAIGKSIEELDCEVVCFETAQACLEALSASNCDLVVTDLSMPEMDGMALLREVKRLKPYVPVIVVTGYGEIPIAVKAVKEGAMDFLEKPLDEDTFLPIVAMALRKSQKMERVGLTDMERDILALVIDGKSNKEIAAQMGRSVRTVENHRYRLMRKLQAENTASLIKIANQLNLKR